MSALRILRPINLVLIAIIQVIVQYVVILPNLPTGITTFTHLQFAMMVLITMCVGAAGYVVNDIYDVAIDEQNKPGKNAVGGELTVSQAWYLYLALTVAAVILTFVLQDPYRWPGLGVMGSATFMLWAYSARFKRTPLIGNIVVSLFAAWSYM